MADEAKLIAVVEARTAQFERALKKIEQQTDRTFKHTEASARRMDSTLRRSSGNVIYLDRSFQGLGRTMVGLGRTLIAGTAIGAILSLTGALGKARDALRQFDQIADTAKATGLDTDFFQALSFGAAEAGVSQEKLNDALITFSKNSGLAAQGKGRMVTALKALNPELLKAIKSTDDQAQRLRLLADALGTETDASERAAIGAATLGDAWADLLPVFEKGAQGLAELQRRAREMGVIIPPEMLANAAELEDKINVLSFAINQNLNQSLVTLAPLLIKVSEGVLAVSQRLREVVGPAESASEVFETLAVNAGKFIALDPLGFWRALRQGAGLFVESADESVDRLGQLREEVAETEARVATMRDTFGEGIFTDQAIAGDLARLRTLKTEIATIEQAIRDAKDADLTPRPAPPQVAAPVNVVDEKETEEIERQKEAVTDLIGELQFELDQLSRTAEEQRVQAALRQAGAAATAEQRAEIERLTRAIEGEEAAQEALADATEQAAERAAQAQEEAAQRIEEAQRESIARLDALRSTTQGLLSTFNDELFRTGSLMDALTAAAQELQRVLLRIAEQALIEALFGPQGQPLGGILGGLLGGGGVGTAAPRVTVPVAVQPIPTQTAAAPVAGVTSRTLLPPVIERTIPTLQSFGRSVDEAGRNLLEFAPAVGGAASAVEATTGRFDSLLSLIRRSEVGPAGGFSTTLGFGRFGGAGQDLTRMTLDEIDALQTQILNNPANTFGASPVGAFQITRTTMRGLREQMGLTGQELFTPELQTAMAERLIQNRLAQPGDPIANLRNEWEGLRNINADEIQGALDAAGSQIAESGAEFTSTFDPALKSITSSISEAGGAFTPQFRSGLFNLANTVQSSAPAFGAQFQSALQSVLNSIQPGQVGSGLGLASFLSNIGYAGLFQHGGRLRPGEWGIAGEAGPELVYGPATVLPRLTSPHERARRDRSGGDVTVHNTFVIDSMDNPRSQNQVAARSAESVRRATRVM